MGLTSYLAFLQIVEHFVIQPFTVGTFVVVAAVVVVGLRQIVIAFSFEGSLNQNWLFIRQQ